MPYQLIASTFQRHGWLFAALIVAISLPAAWGLRGLRFDGSPRNVFATDSEDFQFLQQAMEQFGTDDNDCLLMVSGERLFAPESVAGLRELVARAERVEGVAKVWSLLPFLPAEDAGAEALERTGDRLRTHPLVGGQLLSDDGRATLVIVRLDPTRNVLERFEPPVRELDQIARQLSAEYPIQVQGTGIPPLRVEIFRAVQSEAATFMLGGAVLALLTSLVVFRRLSLVVISSFGPLLGAFWTLGYMGLLNQPLNVINVVLPTLVVAVGLTNAIHLVIHIRRGLAEGHTPRTAAAEALRQLGGACTLAAGTTAIGFGSLVASQAGIIRQFAVVCAGGVLLSLLAVMLSVPVLSLLLLRGQAGQRLRRPYRLPLALDLVTRRLLRVAPWVVVLGGVVTVSLASSALFLRPDSQLSETIPRDRPSYQTLEQCNQRFGGAVQVMAVVQWDEGRRFRSPQVLEALVEVERLFAAHESTHHPLSILNVLRTLPGPNNDLRWKVPLLAGVPSELTRRFVRDDLRRAVVIARLPDLGGAEYQRIFDQLQADMRRWADQQEGVEIRLTGTPVLASRNINQMIADLGTSLSLAVVVIFLVISAAFRSLRLGLISILPNMFPLAATSALLVLTGRPLQLSSVLVFTICLGIAVDDTIHYLNRFVQERRQRTDLTLILRRTSAAVGTALVVSTAVLLAGFGSLLVSEIPTTRLFAELACTAISAALLGDLVFLPALLKCFPPRPAAQAAWIPPGESSRPGESPGSEGHGGASRSGEARPCAES